MASPGAATAGPGLRLGRGRRVRSRNLPRPAHGDRGLARRPAAGRWASTTARSSSATSDGGEQSDVPGRRPPRPGRRLVFSPAGMLAVGHENGVRLLDLAANPPMPEAAANRARTSTSSISRPSPWSSRPAASTWRRAPRTSARCGSGGSTATGRPRWSSMTRGPGVPAGLHRQQPGPDLRRLRRRPGIPAPRSPGGRGPLDLSRPPGQDPAVERHARPAVPAVPRRATRRARIWDLKDRTCRRLRGPGPPVPSSTTTGWS